MRDGAMSLRQLLFDTRRDCIAIGYFRFRIAATIAATVPIAAPMAANIETVTPVCCSIVGSLRFPFSVPSAMMSQYAAGFSNELDGTLRYRSRASYVWRYSCAGTASSEPMTPPTLLPGMTS